MSEAKDIPQVIVEDKAEKKITTDLDVATPEQVSKVLQNVAEKYYESASELEASWQDKKAGKVWIKLGSLLEATSDKAETIVKKFQ